jgi:hypothetical protein
MRNGPISADSHKPTRNRRALPETLATLILTFVLGLGAMVASAPVASAAPAPSAVSAAVPTAGSLTYHYRVFGFQVCNWQGHFGATTYNYWAPYSMRCYDLSFPAGFTITGGLDINGYCRAKYPGSYAGLVANNVDGWRCIKRVY